jgi:hypothetical protein
MHDEPSKRRRVIDFRARANTHETMGYIRPRIADIRAMNLPPPDGSDWYEAPEETVEEFVARLDRAGIDATVFVGRNRGSTPGWPLTNEWVAEAMRQFPGRILGIAGVDAKRLDSVKDDLVYAVRELGLLGANLDAFQVNAAPDDPQFDRVYQACTELGIPVIITLGAMPGIAAELRCWPLCLDRVALRHPTLKIVACHGGWPFVTEMIAVAWRNPNVYFDNSFYHFAPGANLLVEAANQFIGWKMVYASAYPFAPLEQTLERFVKLGFNNETLQRVLYGNAAHLFELEKKR